MYNLDRGEVEQMNSSRLKNINNYNNTMWGVNTADQLRGAYRHYHWIRNIKWWRDIWNWSVRVHMFNAYIMYVNLNVQAGKLKKYLLFYYELCKPISLSWINPEDVHYSKVISLYRKIDWDTENSSVASTITMDKFNSSKIRATEINNASVAIISNISRIRPYKTLDHYLDIGEKSAMCSVHRWFGIDSERHTYYFYSCNGNMCVL